MIPGDDEKSDSPRDPRVAAGEPAPSIVGGIGFRVDDLSSGDEGVPPKLGESSVDTHDDQVNAGEEKIPPAAPKGFADVAKADDETVDESVAHSDDDEDSPRKVTSLVDAFEPAAEAAAAEAGEAKPKAKRRRKKAEEPPGLPKVDDELMHWYVLKVQSNREDSIADAIKRRLKIAGVDPHVGEVVVPTEKVLEIKDGKKRVVKRKFYPGYIMLRMELTDDVWFVIRDTPGVGHFLGAAEKPLPMTAQDVERMLGRTVSTEAEAAVKEAAPRPAIEFVKGDRVVIREGPFENFEGDVEEVNEDKGTVRVMIQIFGRPTPVDVKYWEVGKVRM
jgi:transcription termination/antitermination protein NusG